MKKYLPLLISFILLPNLALSAVLPTKKSITKSTQIKTNIIIPEEEAVIKAYENMLPSVVSIVISKEIPNLVGGVTKQDTGGGTGFIVSSDGYIITNKHVVLKDDVDYTVVTSSGKEYAGSVLARDPLFDIAIVKIEDQGLIPAKLGDSDKIKIGQTVLAIGNVLTEFRNTVTRGIVSGVGRTITASGAGVTETIEGAIQTDTSINPGNSGGPLINLRGEVIGINTAINRAGEALGFALPINVSKQALNNFKKNGKIIRTFLGVRYAMLNRAVARAYNLGVTEGAYVLIKNNRGEPGLIPDGPADKAGIKGGDIILEINNQTLTARKPLAAAISEHEPNQELNFKILRDNREINIKAVLGERTVD